LINFKASNPFGCKFKSWIQQYMIYYGFNKHCDIIFLILKGLVIKFVLSLLICWAGPEKTVIIKQVSYEMDEIYTLFLKFMCLLFKWCDSVSFIEFTLHQHFFRHHQITLHCKREKRSRAKAWYSAGLIRGQAAEATANHCVFCVLVFHFVSSSLTAWDSVFS
jgi:hypothetical protein